VRINFISLTLCGFLATGMANAAESVSQRNMALTLGGFYSQSDSSIDVTDPTQGGSFTLDYESDLGLDEFQFLPFAEFSYRFADRHYVYADWKQLHRNSEIRALERPFQVEIDDLIYDVKAGGKLATSLNIDIARLGYGYDLVQGNNYTLGLSLGLHAMFIDASFEGVIGVCSGAELVNNVCGSTAIPRVVDENVTAPLPDIGVYGHYEFSPRWRFNAHAQYFHVKLDDIEGSLIDIKAGVEAEIADNWHMSVAYNYYKVDVNVAQNNAAPGVKIADYNVYYSFIGPMLSISYRF
jgi:hypothetical protein